MKRTIIVLILIFFITSCTDKPEGKTWQEYAIITGDFTKCNRASHPDVCKTGFTQATGDGRACGSISDEKWKKTCQAYDRGLRAHATEEVIEEKGCKYDSECPAICEGDVAWKQGCNPRKGKCIKTFDTDCNQEVETFGSNSFPKVCSKGECVRDEEAIEKKKEELEEKKMNLREEMRVASKTRSDLLSVKDEAFTKCMDGLSFGTAVLIKEFATKTAGLISGGVSVVKGASEHVVSWTTPIPDYVGKGIDEMKKAGTDQQKLSLDEYVVLYCKMNEFFGHLLDESDDYIDDLTERARKTDAEYDALP